jgi:hypothetical protein
VRKRAGTPPASPGAIDLSRPVHGPPLAARPRTYPESADGRYPFDAAEGHATSRRRSTTAQTSVAEVIVVVSA